MSDATGSQHETWYVPEVTYGVTPATPAFTKVCHESNSVGLKKDTLEIQCLNPNRQGRDVRGGAESVSGDVGSPFEYAGFDDWLEMVFMGTWTANVLEIGTVERSMTMQRNFLNLTTPEFHRTTGVKVKSLAISAQANDIVSATFSMLGQQLDKDNLTTEIAGTTYNAYTKNEAFDSFTGTITIAGVGTAIATGIDFTIDDQQDVRYSIGSRNTKEPEAKDVLANGSLTAFYDDETTLYRYFLNDTPVAITYTLTTPGGDSYLIEFPRVKLTEANLDVSGPEQMIVPYTMEILFDEAEDTTARITRIPA